MKLFSNIINGLQKDMDLRLRRQDLINANIANADTPGFKPKELDFQSELNAYMQNNDGMMMATSPLHFGSQPKFDEIQGEIIEQAGATSPDQNAVDLDRQMAEMSANSLHYRASAKMIHKKMSLLKYAINETR